MCHINWMQHHILPTLCEPTVAILQFPHKTSLFTIVCCKRRTSYWSFWEEAALHIFCPALFGKKEDLLSYDDMRYTITFNKMRFFIYFPVCISCIMTGFSAKLYEGHFFLHKKVFLSPKSQRVKKEKPTRDFLSPFNIKA